MIKRCGIVDDFQAAPLGRKCGGTLGEGKEEVIEVPKLPTVWQYWQHFRTGPFKIYQNHPRQVFDLDGAEKKVGVFDIGFPSYLIKYLINNCG
mmetsp:Transcript_27220/g.40190  ORF Transcript_27220/g.40190 Transcript_27220/m.40190 type:complete len:93 (-) Transcript_27220:1301-1579(-)